MSAEEAEKGLGVNGRRLVSGVQLRRKEMRVDPRANHRGENMQERIPKEVNPILPLALYMASNSVIVCKIHSVLQVKDAWYRQEC